MLFRQEQWAVRYPLAVALMLSMLLLPVLWLLRVEYIGAIILAVLGAAAALQRNAGVLLLVVLLPLAHAGVGLDALGGFGIFDFYALWFLMIFALKWSMSGSAVSAGQSGLALGLAMMISFIPSLLNAPDLAVSGRGFAQLLASLLLFAAVADALVRGGDRRFPGLLLWTFAVVSAVVGAYGILEALRGSVVQVLTGRAFFSLFQDVNYYASYLLMGLSLSLGLTLASRSVPLRLLGLALSVVQTTAIVASVSRSALLVLVFIVLAFTLYLLMRGGFARKVMALVILAGFVGSAGVVLSTGLAKKLVDVFTLSQRVESVVQGRDASLAQRMTILQVVWRMVETHPVIGVGFNNIEKAFNSYREGSLSTGPSRSAHNTPLRILAETGVTGFLVSVLFVIFLLSRLVRGIRLARSDPEEAQMFGIGVAVAGFLLSSLALDQLFEPHFWIVAGIGVACTHLIASDPRAIKRPES